MVLLGSAAAGFFLARPLRRRVRVDPGLPPAWRRSPWSTERPSSTGYGQRRRRV